MDDESSRCRFFFSQHAEINQVVSTLKASTSIYKMGKWGPHYYSSKLNNKKKTEDIKAQTCQI